MQRCFFIFCFLFISGLSAHAATYAIVKKDSGIRFSVDYLTFLPIRGEFQDFSGSLHLSEASNKIQSLVIDIRSDSLHTGDTHRDEHLKNEGFFEVSRYPRIQFEARDFFISKKEEKTTIVGKMKIRNIIRKVPAEITIIESNKDRVIASFSLQLNRSDFSISASHAYQDSEFLIGQNVRAFGVIAAEKSN